MATTTRSARSLVRPGSTLALALTLAFAHGCAGPRSVGSDGGARPDAEMPNDAEADATDAESDATSADEATTEPDAGTPGEDSAVLPDDVSAVDVSAPPDDTGASPAFPYAGPGPLIARTQATSVTLPTSTGCTGAACTVALQWTTPLAPGASIAAPYPLVVFSNGFQLTASQYQSYALRLASWGYTALRWDTSETLLRSLGHETLARMLVALVSHAASENDRAGSPLAGLVSTSRVLLAGHSRGGKVSVLAATRDARVAGVVLLDPVDSAPPLANPASEYPSAVASLRGSPRVIPLVALGSGLGGASTLGMSCAPTSANYAQFWNAGRAPAWEVVFTAAGHMSFLDNPNCGLTCSVCVAGTAAAERVRAASRTLLVAWSERVLRDADVSAYGPGGAWLRLAMTDGFATARAR